MAHYSTTSTRSSVALNVAPSLVASAGKNMKIWSSVAAAVAVAKDIVA